MLLGKIIAVLNEIKFCPDLKRIDDKSFDFYLENGVDFEEMKHLVKWKIMRKIILIILF